MNDDQLLIGVDFTSRPTQRKPIVVALGRRAGDVVELRGWQRVDTLDGFSRWLADAAASWLGGFDLPFGLPRELVSGLDWPTDWYACMRHYAALTRAQIRDTFAAWCAARPAGAKFAHRACDRPAGSSPSMKWVNPPVAYMLHAGVPMLLDAGVHLPAHEPPRPRSARVALEAYPGLLARELVGARSYKSDEPVKQTEERLLARLAIVDALRDGRTRLRLALRADAAAIATMVDDASGDALDAALCLLQAGWASTRPRYGMPLDVDPLEGWIVSA